MSLFVCENCRAVENTALGHFWARQARAEVGDGDGRALCSECAGKGWHGRFPKRVYDPARDRVQWVDGVWIEANP